jgi:nucleotide-binding universal stress UspA family protein
MTIIVGYLPTDEGDAAVTAAADEARRRGTGLVIFNVSTGASRVDTHLATPEALTALCDTLTGEGLHVDIQQSIRGHDPADEILTAAEQHQADLIVIGLRRRTAVGKLLLGSTAQRILLSADCPVLAVKATHD